ncbi:MAG TPA: hypothetical protein ENJ88_02430 [Phaeodactylibacter sp.]|nr:hypothetical protein [Phaeodactylibacter sp.]
MKKNKITLSEALKLLQQKKLNEHYEIVYAEADKVEATDAIKLGSLGIDVPEEKIYYEDAAIEEDDEFDGEWIRIVSDVEDYKKHLTFHLDVDEEIEEWLASTDIDLDALINELITGFYRASKALEKKEKKKSYL